MISRITNPIIFNEMVKDIFETFKDDDINEGHACGLLHDTKSIINNFSNATLLNWDVFVWANKEGNKKYDAVIIFINEKSIKFGCTFFSEFIWLSKNKKVGYKLLKEATAFAREKNFEYITIATSARNPNSPRFKKFYEKIGFMEDSTHFIAKI